MDDTDRSTGADTSEEHCIKQGNLPAYFSVFAEFKLKGLHYFNVGRFGMPVSNRNKTDDCL